MSKMDVWKQKVWNLNVKNFSHSNARQIGIDPIRENRTKQKEVNRKGRKRNKLLVSFESKSSWKSDPHKKKAKTKPA